MRYQTAPGAVETRRLTPSDPAFVPPPAPEASDVLRTYFGLGVEHILLGLDHLLFVFALLLLIRDPWRLAGAITAFTVAHSLSLAAAALGWLVVPAPPVEAVVALSIMFVASELARPAGRDLRLSEHAPWSVAFAFGLLHGLGFARALLDIGLPAEETPLALLAFNLGVEAGQLLFVAAALAVWAALRRLEPERLARNFGRGGAGTRGLAYVIGSLAGVWFAGGRLVRPARGRFLTLPPGPAIA